MRVVIVAFGYRSERLRLQPWRYVHEIARNLSDFGVKVFVISDRCSQLPNEEVIDDVQAIRLCHVKHFPPRNFDKIAETISKINPDIILWLMGLTSFFQRALYKRLKCPIVALVGSPAYTRREILKSMRIAANIYDIKRYVTNLVETFIPKRLIRNTFGFSGVKLVITMSRRNTERLKKIGVDPDKLICIPPGVDPHFLQLPSSEDIEKARVNACQNTSNQFLITYLGPPLMIRGVDTLLHAVKLALKSSPLLEYRLQVLILSRRWGNEYYIHEQRLRRLIAKLGLDKVVKLESGFLSEEEVKAYMVASDLVTLPFKFVTSDVPLSVMEAASCGTPVLSTNLDGIPELLESNRGLIIEGGDFKSLAQLISYHSEHPEELRRYGKLARRYMLGRPTWKDSARMILTFLNGLIR